MSNVELIRVFVRDGKGGNPVPLVADARGMEAAAMQRVAAAHGHESAFVLPSDAGCDWRLRFFVPHHEMEMCGHATVGTLWALRQWGRWTTSTARIETLSGIVLANWDEASQRVWISQPAVRTAKLDAAASVRVAMQLGLPAGNHTVVNAATSRVKTLIALPSVAMLDALQPDFSTMAPLCASIGSTGLYPYAFGTPRVDGTPVVHARQFPKSSGYPEDAATGIAAAALWGYLNQTKQLHGRGRTAASMAVWQGDAMGCPSEILVAPRHADSGAPDGCWLSGGVAWGEP